MYPQRRRMMRQSLELGLVITLLVFGLSACGGGTADAVLEKIARTTGWQRATEAARHLMEEQGSVRGVDGPLSSLYQGGTMLLHSRAGQLALAAVALAGIVAFVLGIGELGAVLERTEAGRWLCLFWVPAYILAIVVHEAGHAFTTKHFGREVPRVGVG